MDRNGVLVAVILIMLVGRGSPSQFGDILRILASVGVQNGKQTEKDDSPSPSPTPIVKEDKPVISSAKDVPKLDQNGKLPQLKNSPKSEPKSLDGASHGGSGNGGDGEKKKSIRNDAPTTHEDSQVNVKGKGECDAFTNRCTDQHLIACLQPGSGSGQSYLVVINEGEDFLIVTIRAPPTVKLGAEKIELPKNRFRKVNVSSIGQDSSEIVLVTNNGRCILHTNPPVSALNFFQNLPSYATRMTPIYGAYVLFITVLIVGGMWACCKFGKRGRHGDGGVPYQELEMGLPQSSTTIDMDTTDGWDQGWDDDWEEKQMAKSSEIRPVGSVSANGLTSRSPRREGWEDDWDD